MKKIMFNDKYGLTQAVLEGRKSMTRRIVPDSILRHANMEAEVLGGKLPDRIMDHIPYCYSEVVAVAQSYKDAKYPPSYIIDEFHPNIEYEAGWTNKMFVRGVLMPHLIRITNVCVERLQDISDEDCIREGVRKKSDFPHKKSQPFYFDGGKHSWDNSFRTPRQAFAALINKVSGKGTWQSNPWVFVYEFELVK